MEIKYLLFETVIVSFFSYHTILSSIILSIPILDHLTWIGTVLLRSADWHSFYVGFAWEKEQENITRAISALRKKCSFPVTISSVYASSVKFFSFLRIWLHFLTESLMKNWIFYAVLMKLSNKPLSSWRILNFLCQQ